MKQQHPLTGHAGIRWFVALWLTLATSFALAAAADRQHSQSILWQVQKPGMETGYLLGTMHVSDPRVTNFPPEIDQVLDDAQQLVLEVRMDAEAQQSVWKSMQMKTGKSLLSLLSDQEVAEVRRAFVKRGKPFLANQAMLMKPWAVMVILSMPKDMGVPMDLKLQNLFMSDSRPVHSLETINEQLGVFDRIPLSQQVVMLKETLEYMPKMDQWMNKMFSYYLSGNLNGLMELNNQYLKESQNPSLDELMNELISVRNHRMAGRAEHFLKMGKTVIAVGALHLPGDDGLINLLRDRGYQLSPIALSR